MESFSVFGRVQTGSCCNVIPAYPAQKPYREVSKRRHDLRTIFGADLGAIFVEGGIPDVVAPVFDLPMTAGQGQERLRVGLIGRHAGQAKGVLGADFSRLFLDGGANDEERLGEMREIDGGLGCDVDLADFDPTMSGVTAFCL